MENVRYHPPVFGLPAALEINAEGLCALIADSQFDVNTRQLFQQLLKNAKKESKEYGLPLYRFLYVIHRSGQIQSWID